MISLDVKGVMVKDVVTYPKNAKIQDMAKIMAQKNISCVVIVKGKKPIGILTERDVMKKIVSPNRKIDKLTAEDIMTKNPIVIQETENMFAAAALMEKRKIRRLPVVKGDVLVGIITETDVIRAMTHVAKYLNQKLIEYITNS
jgi:CBS domain-containing protein